MSYSPNIEKVEIVDNATGRTVELDSNGNAALILNADQDNDGGEVGSPFVRFLQDSALTSSVIGHAQGAGTKPNGGTFTNGLSNALIIACEQSSAIQIGSNNVSTMTVIQNGVGINTNAPGHLLDVAGTARIGGTTVQMRVERSSSSGDWNNRHVLLSGNPDPGIGFQNGASASVFKWWTGANQFECRNGNDNAWVPITASSFAVNSDYRLKTNIEPLASALSDVLAMNPCSYTYINDNNKSVGFIAHEIQQIAPHAVLGQKDAELDDGTPVYQSVDLSKLVPVLTKAIQELKAELDTVKAELSTLKE